MTHKNAKFMLFANERKKNTAIQIRFLSNQILVLVLKIYHSGSNLFIKAGEPSLASWL